MLSSLQVWSFGKGLVIVGFGEEHLRGSLVFKAVPDSLLREDWRDATEDELLAANKKIDENDGIACVLKFKDAESVDRIIGFLELLKLEMGW